MSEILTEKVRSIITLCIENTSYAPQDFQLFGADDYRGKVNFGNLPDIKITSPSPATNYGALMVDSQTKNGEARDGKSWNKYKQTEGLAVTNIYCDNKLKFKFVRHKRDYDFKVGKSMDEYVSVGEISTSPITNRRERKKPIYVAGDVCIKPDGWQLQPREMLMIDIELEFNFSMQEVQTKPTAFIKLLIENTGNKPQKYVLFNPNLNNLAGFGNSPDVKIAWDTKVEYWSRTKEHSRASAEKYGYHYDSGYDDGKKPEERLQTYRDLLDYIQGVNRRKVSQPLRVVNVYAPKRGYFLLALYIQRG